jgi:pimeloyl-ACP methyl ester carboxylesterase
MRLLAGALALGCAFMSASLAAGETASAPGGGALDYQACGSGPQAVVLIHDGVLHSAGFDAVWPALCQRYRVVRYDRRGYGRSPAATAPYLATDDVAAVMRAAGVARATVVGASEGGGIAVNFALAHPEAVDRLVLVGPSVAGLAVSDHFRQRGARVIAALRQGGAG